MVQASPGDGKRKRGFDRKFVVMLGRVAVRTAGTAGLGASAQRFVDDRLDGARAATALGTASEASVELLGVAGKMLRTLHGSADVVVAKHVARTDDHLKRQAHR